MRSTRRPALESSDAFGTVATVGAGCVLKAADPVERFPSLPSAVNWRCVYLQYVGQEAAAFEEVRRIAEHTDNIWTRLHYTLGLYRRREHAQAIELSDRRQPGPHRPARWYSSRAYHLVELPDGPARTLALYQELTAQHPVRSEPMADMGITVLLLLGRKSEAVAASREFRRRGSLT